MTTSSYCRMRIFYDESSGSEKLLVFCSKVTFLNILLAYFFQAYFFQANFLVFFSFFRFFQLLCEFW